MDSGGCVPRVLQTSGVGTGQGGGGSRGGPERCISAPMTRSPVRIPVPEVSGRPTRPVVPGEGRVGVSGRRRRDAGRPDGVEGRLEVPATGGGGDGPGTVGVTPEVVAEPPDRLPVVWGPGRTPGTRDGREVVRSHPGRLGVEEVGPAPVPPDVPADPDIGVTKGQVVALPPVFPDPHTPPTTAPGQTSRVQKGRHPRPHTPGVRGSGPRQADVPAPRPPPTAQTVEPSVHSGTPIPGVGGSRPVFRIRRRK